VGDGVLRVELDDLLEDVERVAFTTLATQARRHFVVSCERVAGEAQLRVDLREPRDDVPVTPLEVLRMLADDAADLLVDRDGFDAEALAVVVLADLLVDFDRPLVGFELELQIADLQERADVARVFGDQLLVLGDRLVVLLAIDKPLCRLKYSLAIDRHVPNLSLASRRSATRGHIPAIPRPIRGTRPGPHLAPP
jgi:hypothetical protein